MKFSNNNIQINIKIPQWVSVPFFRVRYLYRKWKYLAFPDHCTVCNKRMFVRYYEISHRFSNGKTLTVHNHAFDSSTNRTMHVCRDCMLTELETKQWTPRFTHMHKSKGRSDRYGYRFWSSKHCAVTGNNVRSFKDVEIYPYIDMTLCTVAWNHDYISKAAIIECVRDGKISTSHWSMDGNRHGPINHVGLFINEKGELV